MIFVLFASTPSLPLSCLIQSLLPLPLAPSIDITFAVCAVAAPFLSAREAR